MKHSIDYHQDTIFKPLPILKDVYKFYDASNRRIGRQAIANRLKDTLDEIDIPLTLLESNDSIRVKLKKALGFAQ